MYKIISPAYVQRLSDNAFIPVDEANSDYSAYLAWIADGNEPVEGEQE